MVPPSSQRVSRVRWYSGSCQRSILFTYGTITLYRCSSQSIQLRMKAACCSRGISVDFSSSPYLDVSVQAVPHVHLWIQCTLTEYCSAGFPHSDIHGSKPICGSPWLFAACRVLHRLSVPRHSPCALYSLTSCLADISRYRELLE